MIGTECDVEPLALEGVHFPRSIVGPRETGFGISGRSGVLAGVATVQLNVVWQAAQSPAIARYRPRSSNSALGVSANCASAQEVARASKTAQRDGATRFADRIAALGTRLMKRVFVDRAIFDDHEKVTRSWSTQVVEQAP